MRKTASLLLVALVSLALIAGFLHFALPGAAATTSSRTLEAMRVSSPLALNGDLSDWPNAQTLVLNLNSAQYGAGNFTGFANFGAAIRSAWDDNYLYFGIVVTDSAIVADSSNIWDDDSTEITLDGAHDGRCCLAGDHQYTVAADGRLADFGTVIKAGAPGVSVTVRQAAPGYVVEMAIPLISLTGSPVVSGTVMGINAGLNDDADGGRRDRRLVWIGNSTLDFTNLGELVFSGSGSPVATATPTTTGNPPATSTSTVSPASPTATVPATMTATPAPATTATMTPTPQATVPVDQRLAALEVNLAGLEERIKAILDILQRAGRLPAATVTALNATPTLVGRSVATPAAGASVSPAQTKTSGTPLVKAITDPLAYVQGVNCGGPAYNAANGDAYGADQAYVAGGWGYLNGQTSQVTSAISNTSDATLYQSERYNLTGYSFDVPPGRYEVVLKFAEIYAYALTGSRIFDVKIEDQVAFANLDIMARAGRFTALDLTYTAVVTDGQLSIAFVPKASVAKINAMRVRGVGGPGPTPTPSINDRITTVSDKMTQLEAMVSTILDVFRSTQGGPTTPTLTPTSTAVITGPSATPTLTFTPAPTATRTSTPGGPTPTPHRSDKKGIAGGDDPVALRDLGVAWGYIWYTAPNNFNSLYQHVPMIWGKDYDATEVQSLARAHPGSYWLIWNEPDYWQQANIAPTDAAQMYRVLRPLIKAADPTAKLIVGGVFNLDTDWLSAFRSEYQRLYGAPPVVEGWHVHYYVGRDEYNTATWRSNMSAVRDWMVANGGLTELWLTEFGCLNGEAVASQIMTEQVPWLNSQSWVTRYAWYAAYASGSGCPGCTGSLFNADGGLSNLGQLYRQLP